MSNLIQIKTFGLKRKPVSGEVCVSRTDFLKASFFFNVGIELRCEAFIMFIFLMENIYVQFEGIV